MTIARADFDDLQWDKNDEDWDKAQKQLRLPQACRLAESFVGKKFGKRGKLIPPMTVGGYNLLYRIRQEGEPQDVLLRLPIPHLVQFPKEKTPPEAAMSNYVARNTQIPTPKVFFSGQDSEVGPYIILQYVEHKTVMAQLLSAPNEDPDESYVLDPNISESLLLDFYKKASSIVLHLFQHTFLRIGSLCENNGSFSVVGRPITKSMNEMLQLANIPRAVLPPKDKTYSTANEYYLHLSEMHMAQLTFQQNDLVSTEDDCRNKYVSRQLFRRLAKEGRLSTFGFMEDNWSAQSKTMKRVLLPAPSDSSSFRIFSDDIRTGNFLIDEANEIVAAIDWEFTYTAPAQFALDPPWWLLLETPEMWPTGIDDWSNIYNKRVQTWLTAMRYSEECMNLDSDSKYLSNYMVESWETGRFWLNYATRKSWAFDSIFWKFLDEKFFGGREINVLEQDLWKTRVDLLTVEEKDAMEPFVERKIIESKFRTLVEWDEKLAKDRLAEVLFD